MGDEPKRDDARRQENVRSENIREDLRYSRIRDERDTAINKARSPEALARRFGVTGPVSGSLGQPNSPQKCKRYAFEKADAEKVATRLVDFAERVENYPSERAFENFKEYVLEGIDQHLPPSDDKEAIHAEVLGLRYTGGRNALGPILDPNAEVRLATVYKLHRLAKCEASRGYPWSNRVG